MTNSIETMRRQDSALAMLRSQKRGFIGLQLHWRGRSSSVVDFTLTSFAFNVLGISFGSLQGRWIRVVLGWNKDPIFVT